MKLSDLPTPHDDNAERGVIANMLAHPAAAKLAVENLRASDFYCLLHGEIFAACCRVSAAAGDLSDERAIDAALGAMGNPVVEDGARFRLRGCFQDSAGVSGAHVEGHVRCVQQAARRRELAELLELALVDLTADNPVSADVVIRRLQKEFSRSAKAAKSGSQTSFPTTANAGKCLTRVRDNDRTGEELAGVTG